MTTSIVRRESRGVTLVELLVAMVIVSIGMMGLVNLWAVSFLVTRNNGDLSHGYTLGRTTMERIRMSGFTNAAEGTTNTFYSGVPTALPSQTSAALYRVTTSIVSDSVTSGTSGSAGAVPANTALRTVTVTVTQLQANTVAYTSFTYLTRAGI